MKKLMAFALLLQILCSNYSSAQGENSFNTQFDKDATQLNLKNAYLLGYLCTMTYPDYLRFLISNPPPGKESNTVKNLQRHDDAFENAYRNELSFLFKPKLSGSSLSINKNITLPDASVKGLNTIGTEPDVKFQFFHKCNANGYDPEALLITTPTTIYVVFRGTDRVACNVNSNGYEWMEWIGTDFKFLKRDATVIHPSVRGSVHRGMVESLLYDNFASDLGTAINNAVVNKITNQRKEVWITGHSLGGGHAQLFAMYLKAQYSIKAQGLYIYEAPHPGDPTFTAQLNSDIGKSRIQRFEFSDDPICTLPPQSLPFDFGRAGERNYFKDYNSTNTRSEQNIADDLRLFCVFGNLAVNAASTGRFVFPPLCPGTTCHHHPTLILEAIRHQLSQTQQSSLPAAVPLPEAGDNCTRGELTKAEDNNLINNTATAVETALAEVAWAATNIADNVLGSGLAEGSYRLVCYAFKNSEKKYLTWNGTGNSQLTISNTGTVFTVKHKDPSLCQLPGGYQLYKGQYNMAANVKFAAGLPTGFEENNNIIMRPKDDCIGDEETWYLLKVPNKTNTYVLYNINTHKVLDAPNNCLTSSGNCPVNEFDAASNDATQVWVLEKVN